MAMAVVLSFKRSIWHKTTALHSVSYFWYPLTKLAQRIKLANLDSQILILEKFDRAAISLQHTSSLHWSNVYLPFPCKTEFLFMATKAGLHAYMSSKIKANPLLIRCRGGTPLLACVLSNIDSWDKQCQTIELLLENGANPNDTFEGHTIWHYWIHYLHVYGSDDLRKGRYITKLMLVHDVNLNVCCFTPDNPVLTQVYLKKKCCWRDFYIIRNMASEMPNHGKDEIKLENVDKRSRGGSQGSDKSKTSFEHEHSLVSVIKDVFKNDPNYRNELLELIETSRAKRKAKEKPRFRNLEKRPKTQSRQEEIRVADFGPLKW